MTFRVFLAPRHGVEMRLILQAACSVCCLLVAAAVQTSEMGNHRLVATLGALPEFKALPLPQPVFWELKTARIVSLLENKHANKNPAQNSRTEKIFQFTGKSKYCAMEQLWTAYVAVSGCTFTSGRSLSSVTILMAHRCQSKLDFLTGWTEILEMLEEHLKMLHTFNKIMCE